MPEHSTIAAAHDGAAHGDSSDTATTITRVVLQNYKSIAHGDVWLGPLTFLVGRNASGKSNFLDALRFVADALRQTLEGAIRSRGSIAAISRLARGVYQPLGVRIEFRLRDGRIGSYGFEIGTRRIGMPFVLHREECRLWIPGEERAAIYFRVQDGQVSANVESMPASLPNHLYLVNASGVAAFQDVYRALTAMRFYDFDPGRMQRSTSAGEELILAEDGSNCSGVLLRLTNHHPQFMTRLREYLQVVVPGLLDVYAFEFGGQYALGFKQSGESGMPPFGAEQMSDGTLRALGILLALFQQVPDTDRFLSLIGIEEPETGLHRAAMAALRGAFADASATTQLLMTTHSTDLLDAKDVDAEWIRVVAAEHGVTRIGPLSEATRSIVRDHLATAGELLRSSPLRPAMTGTAQDDTALFNG